MSEALERVIAEQQKKIDELLARDLINIKAWMDEDQRREALVGAVFNLLNWPDKPGKTQAVRDALMNYGYCLTCQCRPCECEGQYD